MKVKHMSKLRRMLSSISDKTDYFYQPATTWLIDCQSSEKETQCLLEAFEIMVNSVGGSFNESVKAEEGNRRYLAVSVNWPTPLARKNFLWLFGGNNSFREVEKVEDTEDSGE